MFVLCGKTASGKDSVAQALIKKGFRRVVTYTTRPKRRGEKDGVTYNFLSDEDFESKVQDGFFLEHSDYTAVEGVWRYGSAIDEKHFADPKAFIILSPSGVREVLKLKNPPTIIYLYANNETIRERLRKRGDSAEESDRRLNSDNKDFASMPGMANKIVYNDRGNEIKDIVEEIIDYVSH